MGGARAVGRETSAFAEAFPGERQFLVHDAFLGRDNWALTKFTLKLLGEPVVHEPLELRLRQHYISGCFFLHSKSYHLSF